MPKAAEPQTAVQNFCAQRAKVTKKESNGRSGAARTTSMPRSGLLLAFLTRTNVNRQKTARRRLLGRERASQFTKKMTRTEKQNSLGSLPTEQARTPALRFDLGISFIDGRGRFRSPYRKCLNLDVCDLLFCQKGIGRLEIAGQKAAEFTNLHYNLFMANYRTKSGREKGVASAKWALARLNWQKHWRFASLLGSSRCAPVAERLAVDATHSRLAIATSSRFSCITFDE